MDDGRDYVCRMGMPKKENIKSITRIWGLRGAPTNPTVKLSQPSMTNMIQSQWPTFINIASTSIKMLNKL